MDTDFVNSLYNSDIDYAYGLDFSPNCTLTQKYGDNKTNLYYFKFEMNHFLKESKITQENFKTEYLVRRLDCIMS